MHVLIADKLSAQTVACLEKLGCEVSVRPELTADDLAAQIGSANILVVRSTKVNTATIEAASDLELIIRAGSGYDTIDVNAASARGIHVANCPGKNANAVAELTIGLLIAADRQIASACADLRAGRWKKKQYGQSFGLKGRTLGLLGFGSISQAVSQAALGLQMRVLAWSRSLTDDVAEAHEIRRAEALAQIAACDAVSIHLPSTPETKHIVGREFLSRMRDGAILINTSRGPLVDTEALREAIASKHLRVALDVYENEPSGGEATFEDSSLAAAITGTPHIGASTEQTSEAIAAEVVRIVRVFQETGRPCGSVNLCQRSPATCQLVVRHLNQVGVLAGVLDGLREEQINVEEMENMIFEGAHAASCTLRLDGEPSPRMIEQLRGNPAILHVTLAK